MKAIILAGGKGSRLKPLTDTIPKALIPIDTETLIEKSLNSLPESVDTVIITTNYLGEKIQEKIGATYRNKKIFYTPQPSEMKGTWAALYGTKDFIENNELFLVLNCDDLFAKAELTLLAQETSPCIGVTKTTMPAKYHGMEINGEGFIQSFQRHPQENREESVQDLFANGVFLLTKAVFSFPPVPLLDGEFGLPQTLLAQKETYPLKAFKLNNWHPCNSFKDLEKIKEIKQIQRALPAQAWQHIEIKENNEILVEIKSSPKIIVGMHGYNASFLIRETLYTMLLQAAEKLPNGLSFKIIEGYRSIEKQKQLYDEALAYITEKNPNLSSEEIEKEVRLAIAKPTPLANHNCGGAIDITLVDTNGDMLDMGGALPHNNTFDIQERKKFPMFSDYITEEQKNNRTTLREIMEIVGFVWYPAEWWHFCYGDRMWAVYTNKTECFYGPLK